MKNPFSINDTERKNWGEVRPIPLYIILLCGTVIIIAGIYLLWNNEYAVNNTMRTKDGGDLAHPKVLNGLSVLIIGLAISSFPVYTFIKRKKRDHENNN